MVSSMSVTSSSATKTISGGDDNDKLGSILSLHHLRFSRVGRVSVPALKR